MILLLLISSLDIILEQMLDLSDPHAVRQVLLIGSHQERDPLYRLILDHFVKSSFGLLHPLSVSRVNNVDHRVAFWGKQII